MTARFEMIKTGGGQYMFILKAANGQTILTGEPYRQRAVARGSIQSAKANAGRSEWFERRVAAGNQAYFVLTAANGRVIGCGALRSSRRAMEKGIRAVMRLGPAARVVGLHET